MLKFIMVVLLGLGLGSSGAYGKKVVKKPLPKTEWGKDFATPRGGAQGVTEVITSLRKSVKDPKTKKQVFKGMVLEGEIAKVCQKKGCWVSLKTDSSKTASSCEEAVKGAAAQKELRVIFKDHGVSVPKGLKGRVQVYGDIKMKKLKKSQVRHFLKDAKCSKEEIAKVEGPLYRYQMTATGIKSI